MFKGKEKIILLICARSASSIKCCITGLLTTGNIVFGIDFVIGKNLVPFPATGIITVFILFKLSPP